MYCQCNPSSHPTEDNRTRARSQSNPLEGKVSSRSCHKDVCQEDEPHPPGLEVSPRELSRISFSVESCVLLLSQA